MASKTGNILKYLLSFLLAGVLVYFACRGIDWREFWAGLKSTNWSWMVLFFAAAYLAVVFRALRWKQLLKPLDPDIRYGKVWDASNVCNLTSIAIPGSGEFVRAAMVSSGKMPFETVFGTMIMERAWDFFALFMLLIAALVFKWGTFGGFFIDNVWHPITDRSFIVWGIVLLVLAMALALAVIYRYRNKVKLFRKIADIVTGALKGFASFAKMKNKFPFLLYTLAIWAMFTGMTWFGLKAIPELSGLSFSDALFVSAIGNFASIIPVPGGIGAYHYLIRMTLTTLYGVTEEIGLLFATLAHEAHAIVSLVLGVWSYMRRMVVMKN